MVAVMAAETKAILFPAPVPAEGRAGGARRSLKAAASAALDLIYPPHCVSCDDPLPPRSNQCLCLACAEKILWIGRDRCRRCGDAVGLGSGVVDDCPSCRTHPPAFVKSSCAVARYAEGPLRDLVLALKFNGKIHVARLLGELIAQRVRATELATPETVVAPCPLTRQASFHRGFNQAEEIAQNVASILKLRFEPRLVTKIRATPPQATLTPEKRRMNLKGAFACQARVAKKCRDARVLLIDDVITTGSTVSECARMLRDAGIGEVHAAAAARG